MKQGKKKRKLVEGKRENQRQKIDYLGWLDGFYGISTFVGYLTPNPFLYR